MRDKITRDTYICKEEECLFDCVGLGNMKMARWINRWLKRITHRWVIVDRKDLDFVIGDVKEARRWIFLFRWGEEWLDCEDVVDNIGLKLNVVIRELEKIAGYKREDTRKNRANKEVAKH